MKTTERFTQTITVLYEAFHNGKLDAMDCEHCAVGNMCGNTSDWTAKYISPSEIIPLKIGNVHRISTTFNNTSGYSSEELAKIEALFIYGSSDESNKKFENIISNRTIEISRSKKNLKEQQKELQYKGLCAVIEYLAKLDGKPNPMDYTKLFERVNDKPKYELTL